MSMLLLAWSTIRTSWGDRRSRAGRLSFHRAGWRTRLRLRLARPSSPATFPTPLASGRFLFLRLFASSLSNFLPWFRAIRNTVQEFLVVLWFALLTVVLVWLFSLRKREAHAIVVLPCRAFIATDHITFNIFLLLVLSTNAPYQFFRAPLFLFLFFLFSSSFLFFSAFFAGSRSGFGGGFRGFFLGKGFGLCSLDRCLGDHIEILVLAFCRATRTSRLIYHLRVSIRS